MKKRSLKNIILSLVLAASMVASTVSVGFAAEIPDADPTAPAESTQDSGQPEGDPSDSSQNGQDEQSGEDQSGNTGDADNPGTEGDEQTNPNQSETTGPDQELGYKLTITGIDEDQNDILAGTYNGEAVEDTYLLLARIYDPTLMADDGTPADESTEPADPNEPIVPEDPQPPAPRPHDYMVLDPTVDNSQYDERMIYHFDEEGIGTLYTGSDVITIAYGDQILSIDTAEGNLPVPSDSDSDSAEFKLKVSVGFLWEIDKNGHAKKHIVDPDKSGTYYKTVDGVLYTVRYDTAAATSVSAIYKGKMYRQGVILKGPRYIVYNKYIYKVDANGTPKVFIKNKKAKSTKKYFYICETPYGNRYLFSIRYRTGYAVAYVKDKSKTSTYGYYTANTKYWVYYNTGKILKSKGDSEPRQALTNNAIKYLGYCESAVGGPSHMGIVSIYNKHKPLPRNYTMKFRDAWCATYVSAMFIETGMIGIFPKECSCAYQVAKWKKLGRWTENDAYVPKPGDIIYYDWQDSGRGNNKGKPDHVGIVLEVKSGKITVIEGNYNDRVQKRIIKVNGRYIRGYGLPWYAKAVK